MVNSLPVSLALMLNMFWPVSAGPKARMLAAASSTKPSNVSDVSVAAAVAAGIEAAASPGPKG